MGPENHSAYDIRVKEERERLLTPDRGRHVLVGEAIATLFDDDVATATTDFEEAHTELHAAEAESIRDAHPNRVREFRAGRHCARAALQRLGIADSPVLRGKDRAPIWPHGVTGSLTHTGQHQRGLCAAAVSRQTVHRAIGLDAEFDDPLGESLWRLVLLPIERAFVESQAEPLRGRTAKLIFSAKECVYKCQYTITREFLEFADVTVELDFERRTFRGRFRRAVGEFAVDSAIDGRFVAVHGLFVTGTSLRA